VSDPSLMSDPSRFHEAATCAPYCRAAAKTGAPRAAPYRAVKEDGHDLTFINRCRAVAILDGNNGAIGRRSAPEAL
jgi:hypothetical protein